MKKIYGFLVFLILSMLTFTVEAAKLESGTESAVAGETEFYVKHDANKIYWGGGFTATEKLSTEPYQLMIGFYDDGRLVSADIIDVDEALMSYEFEEQCIRLAKEPKNLTARAFALSGNGMLTPLSEAIDAKNVEFNVQETEASLFSVRPYFSFNHVDNKIKLIKLGKKTYIEGTVEVDVSGTAMYEMIINVMSGERVLWSETVGITSKINKFMINESLDITANKYLYMTIDFVYDNQMLKETEFIDIKDGYIDVKGRFTEIDLVANTAKLQIEQAKDFEGQEITNENMVVIDVELGDIDSEDCLSVFSEFELSVADYGYKVISYKPLLVNEIVTMPSELYVEDSYEHGEYMEFYESQESSSVVEYELDEDVIVYLNGIEIRSSEAREVLNEYMYAPSTEIKLVNTPKPGASTIDSKIDCIMITSYMTVVVDEVYVQEDKAIIFLKDSTAYNAKITLDLDAQANGEVRYIFTDKDGAEVSYTELKENDVLTIYAMTTEARELEDGSVTFINAILTRDVVDGMITGKNGNKEVYEIDGTEYSFAAWYDDDLEVGDYYTIYLNVFGRIAWYEKSISNIKYGVINRVWENNYGEEVVSMVDANGEIVTYQFYKHSDYITWSEEYYAVKDEAFEDVWEKLIVTYKLTTDNKIYGIESAENLDAGFSITEGEYSKNYQKIGRAKMSDKTKIVDYSKAKDIWCDALTYKVSSKNIDYFVDGENYCIIYGGETFSDGTYSFVLILEGQPPVTKSNSLAVVMSVGTAVNEADGIAYASAAILENGTKKQILFDNKDSVCKGDVIIYGVNDYGLVEEDNLYVLYNCNDSINLDDVEYNQESSVLMPYKSWMPWTSEGYGNGVDKVQLGYGVLVEKYSDWISIGVVSDGTTKVFEEFDVATDANIYVFDQGLASDNGLSVGTMSNLAPTKLPV